MELENPGPELRDARILLADDAADNVRALVRVLERAGYRDVQATTDPTRVADLWLEIEPDLLVLDLHMPGMSGFEVLEALGERRSGTGYEPVLVLTGDTTPATRRRALGLGARDFVTKPFETVEILLRIKNLLETRHLHLQLRRHAEALEARVEERTRELAQAQVEILHRLALAAEYRDDVTGRHAERVGFLSALIADELGLAPDEVELLRRAAPLHDVGKIGIPDAILLKPAPLTPAEFEVMKAHTYVGARILSGSRFRLLQVARQIATTHHERWDGGGYAGLEGPDIPLVGRIVAVADVFDCLTHERPYKPALPVDEAITRIVADRGSHFDPRVVDAFLAVVEGGGLERLERVRPPHGAGDEREPAVGRTLTLPGHPDRQSA